MALSNSRTIRTGTCPKCAQLLTSVKVETIDVIEGVNQKRKGASFVCPYCHVILSVTLDPFAMNADLLDEILKKLGRKG